MIVVTELLPIVGILIPATISPGPNNNIVLHAAAEYGLAAAVSPILAVITGSSALFTITWFSVEVAEQDVAGIRVIIVILGAAYLVWLGLAMFNTTLARSGSGQSNSVLPASFLNIALFQLANPKSWIIMGIVSAHGSHNIHWAILLFTVAVVSGVCLTIWAVVGNVLSGYLQTPRIKVVFNKAMGLSLMFFAGTLPFQLNW